MEENTPTTSEKKDNKKTFLLFAVLIFLVGFAVILTYLITSQQKQLELPTSSPSFFPALTPKPSSISQADTSEIEKEVEDLEDELKGLGEVEGDLTLPEIDFDISY